MCLSQMTACVPDFIERQAPDQGEFTQLCSLEASGEPFARVYGVVLPLFNVAIHTWMVVNPGGGEPSERWEVWPIPDGPYGHVRRNLFSLEQGLVDNGSFVLGEVVGEEARPIVEFVRSEAPEYPCVANYVLAPGPNSASFLQWIIDETGLGVELPPAVIGKDTPCVP
jgi:hypothetical protein